MPPMSHTPTPAEPSQTLPIRVVVEAPAAVAADWLAVGIFEGDAQVPDALKPTAAAGRIGALIESKDLSGNLGDATPVLGLEGLAAGALLVLGLGPRATFGPGAAFSAAVAASKKLASRPRGKVAFALPIVEESANPSAIARALVEGAIVGTRGPGLRKKEPSRHPFAELIVIAAEGGPLDAGTLEVAAREGQIVGEAINLARDLANTPPAEKAPTVLAARIAEAARSAGVSAEVWDQERLKQERFGGLLGVSAGSDEPPAFVVLKYRGRNEGKPLALVGKGVTFDSGGLSIKPSASMEDMKADMTGAAVVAAALLAVARLGLRADVDAYLPMTENLTGGRAMKLGDVLTFRDGQTAEVLNTDAEGRLILADALAYATESSPARIVDLATLTGACLVALGPKVAGLFSNDDASADALLAAAKAAGERLWRMPLDADFKEQLKSHVADFKNIGTRWGGAITAAKFLEQFVAETPWAHLDIAGPAWADADSPTRDVGATGCYVRTLVRLVEETASRESSVAQ